MKLNITALLSVAALLCTGVNAGLSESDKKNLLSGHRKARDIVDAPDMASLSWSDKLASEAQKYANSCPGLTHSDKKARGGQGENISYGGGSVESLFNLWLEEKSDFLKSNYASNLKDITYNGNSIGHYSQVVWAKNTQVGCGLADCHGSKNLVCRYATGNELGEKVYSAPKPKTTTTTTTKKTTTTTTTVKKTTTTTTKAPTTTPPHTTTKAAAPTNANNNGTNGQKLPFVGGNTNLPVGSTTKSVGGANSGVNSGANSGINGGVNGGINGGANGGANAGAITGANAGANAGANGTKGPVVNQIVAEKPKDAKKANDAKKSSNGKENSNDEEGGNGAGIVTGVAVTGSVIGAAAAFILAKKNPKQYEDFKRNLTRKASSIKRGATTVTRRFTTKKTSPTVQNSDYDFNYRTTFADSMAV